MRSSEELEQENKLLRQELHEAERFKTEFLAVLAHELRNPLAPLRNGLRILKLANGDPAEIEKTRTMMDRQLNDLVHLVEDLLDVSRISRGKLELRKTTVSIAKKINIALEACRFFIEKYKHNLTVNISNEPVCVHGDGTRITQIINNLLNNAAKFSGKGGHIWLDVKREGNEAVISVKDAGIGIAPDMLPQVFNMFTQADRSAERTHGGLGIGLSLVKQLTELHGGTVTAHSKGLGCGSEFIVRLPLIKDEVTSDSTEYEVLSTAHRILVVDDNEDAATTMGSVLEFVGNKVMTVYDGFEGIEAAKTYKPEIILMDIGMPKMNGYDACRAIRELPGGKEIIIIALTGWGQDDDRRKTKEAGFDGHLVKPHKDDALMKMISDLKEKRASE